MISGVVRKDSRIMIIGVVRKDSRRIQNHDSWSE